MKRVIIERPAIVRLDCRIIGKIIDRFVDPSKNIFERQHCIAIFHNMRPQESYLVF